MKKYPVVNTVCFFILGIILQYYLQVDKYFLFAVLIFTSVLLIILIKSKVAKRKVELLSLSTILLIIFAGAYRFAIIENNEIFNITKPINSSNIIARVNSIDFSRNNGIEFIATIDSFQYEKSFVKINKQFLFKIKKNRLNKYLSNLKRLTIGDKIVAVGLIQSARSKRNPGEYDYQKYLNSKGIVGIVIYSDIIITPNKSFNLLNIILAIRYSINDKIEELFNTQSSALVKGLLLANRKNIDYETMEYFINSGVVHVLAVSGLHVGFIIIIFLLLFTRTNIYLKYIFTFIGLLLFVFITDFQPSVIRASIMAGALLASYISSRNYNSLNSISIAALIILIFQPNELFNPGFQLSFSAVLSILILYPLLQKWIFKFSMNSQLRKIILFIFISLSATLGTLPFTAHYFHKLSLVSLLANIFVIPLIGLIVGLSIAAISFSYIWFMPAKLLANTAMLLIDIMYKLVAFFGKPDYSFVKISQSSVYDFIIYYAILIILIYTLVNFNSYRSKVVIIILLISNYILWKDITHQSFFTNRYLSVLMIDVGQGDAFLIKLPDGKYLLIDAGANQNGFDNGLKIIAPLLDYLNINKIDYGCISHVDNDHAGGFSSLLSKYYFPNFLKPYANKNNYQDSQFEEQILNSKSNLIHYSKSIIKGGNYRIYILNDSNENNESENDKSGIIKILYGQNSFLFVGDAGMNVENKLIQQYGEFLNSDVLKIGHHGSKYSSSEKFIKVVSPQIALISVGTTNRFGHPSKRVIELLQREKIKIFRTDIDRAVVLESNGNKIFQKVWE